jgi:hypothetical protein
MINSTIQSQTFPPLSEDSMPLRVYFATFGLLLLTGCSAGAPATSAVAVSAIALACQDFTPNTYIGAAIGKTNEVAALGWRHELWDEGGSPSWQSGANGQTWIIGGVTKDATNCTARFVVVAGPPIQPPAAPSPVTTTPSPVTTTPAPVAPPAPAAPPSPLTTVSEGTYLVGTDMQPGTYKSAGSDGCYWARMKDDSGQKIIANDFASGPTRFTAKKGEFVKIAGCTFTKV